MQMKHSKFLKRREYYDWVQHSAGRIEQSVTPVERRRALVAVDPQMPDITVAHSLVDTPEKSTVERTEASVLAAWSR